MNKTLWILVIFVLAGGFAGGYAISRTNRHSGKVHDAGPTSSPATEPIPASVAAGDADQRSAGLAAVVHRFPLTALDVKESMESAAVAVTEDGAVHVAWASRTSPDEWQVFLTNSSDRGESFGRPRVVAKSAVHRVTSQSKGKSITREVRMMPRLVSHGNDLILGWVEAVSDNSAVKYFVARSIDGGKTLAPPTVASVTDGSRPTYTSLAAGPDGRIGASWLDNRTKVQLPAAAISSPAGEFTLDSLSYEPADGRGVCPCCPTKLVLADDGTAYLAFRNQREGYRDIWIAQLPPGTTQFEAPKPVVQPTWKFDGCPHDGPALVVERGRLHVAWMDARGGQPRVYLGRGDANLEKIDTQEVAPDAAHSQGHPAIATDANRTLHVAWDEGSGGPATPAASAATKEVVDEKHGGHSHGGGHGQSGAGETSRVIRYATFADSGDRLIRSVAVAPLDGGFQTRPVVAVHGSGDVYVGWVELSERGKSIAVARLKSEPSAVVALEGNSR